MNGWFADINNADDPEYNPEYPWRPYLQCEGEMCLPLGSVSFASKVDCIDFIQTHILTAPQHVI